MKLTLLSVLFGISVLLMPYRGGAAEKTEAATELNDLITRLREKLKDGKKTEAALAEEIKAFDDLLAKHKGEKTDEVAQILFMKGALYLEVLENTEKGVAIIEQVKREFPDTQQGKRADQVIASIKQQEETKKVSSALVSGSKFPDFEEKDVAGNPLSIAKFKGKVVLVDFWATWCGPCVHELPNVLETYKKHHDKGFEIVGISLDKDKDKLLGFTESQKMSWPQFFDGKGWGNKLAVKYGVNSIPMTYLLDTEGKIIGKSLRGEELEAAVSKALASKSK
jgi:thiol-disulfide isomerase/thioredoxin